MHKELEKEQLLNSYRDLSSERESLESVLTNTALASNDAVDQLA